jgi:acetyl esterase/lipase
MTRAAMVACLAMGAVWAQERSLTELLKVPVSAGAKRIAYGTDPLQFGELRVPEGRGPFPVVVIVHGGCWMAKLGNLDDRAVAMDLLRPLAEDLAKNGIATWNLEYRRLGNVGGGWPGTFLDVARGTDYLRKIAKENRLDLSRVAAMGHSAGGHLVLWLAARGKLPASSALYVKDPLPLKGVVDLDGPGDLRAMAPEQQQRICGAPVIVQLLGGTPEERPERYREASPAEMLPLGVRQEFFAGRMFAAQAPGYEAAAKKAGDRVETIVNPEAGHFVFVDPGTKVWAEVVKKTRAVLGIE